jgi:hypothetical protein
MKIMHWAVAGVLVSPLAAHAFETRLNGFISVGAGMTLQEGQTLITDPVNGGEYENEVSIKPDTMVAIQSLSKVNDRLSATAQMVGYAGTEFDVGFEWAYVNYELSNSVDIKFGRIRMPIFNYSSSLDLGYSYVWVRPPVELYNVFLTSLEGVSADYEFSVGNWYGTLTGYYGETDGTDPETGSYVEFESILGGVVAVDNGSLSLRASHSIDNDVNVVRLDTSVLELPTKFSSASALYDNGTLVLNAEYTRTTFTNNLNNDEASWFGTAGYRVGAFTPHLTYSKFKQLATSTTVLPGAVELKDYAQDISSITAGVRWDFDIAAALKVEYTTRTDKTPDSLPGYEAYLESPFGDAQAVSIAVDVVF